MVSPDSAPARCPQESRSPTSNGHGRCPQVRALRLAADVARVQRGTRCGNSGRRRLTRESRRTSPWARSGQPHHALSQSPMATKRMRRIIQVMALAGHPAENRSASAARVADRSGTASPSKACPPRAATSGSHARLTADRGPEAAEGARRRASAVAFLRERPGRAAPGASAALRSTGGVLREHVRRASYAHRRAANHRSKARSVRGAADGGR
jgi:hypothetical protein